MNRSGWPGVFGGPERGRWTTGYLATRASAIGAGTAEIQRNTITESLLHLPGHQRGRERLAWPIASGSIDSER
jgi:acyl-CoA dehydrogenase